MRRYSIFIIKNEYISAYYNKRNILFKTLKNLYELKDNFNYGLSVYNQICNTFDKKLLVNYFDNKANFIKKNDVYYFYINNEDSKLKIKYSNLILITSNNFSETFKILKIYNNHLFVCDFKSNDYFWINEYNHINSKDKYN